MEKTNLAILRDKAIEELDNPNRNWCKKCDKWSWVDADGICDNCKLNSESISPPKAKAMGIQNARTI